MNGEKVAVGVSAVFGSLEGEAFAYDEVADSSAYEFIYIFMSVVLFGTECEEECFFWETKASAVNEQPVDFRIFGAKTLSTNDFGDGLYVVCHFIMERCWVRSHDLVALATASFVLLSKYVS